MAALLAALALLLFPAAAPAQPGAAAVEELIAVDRLLGQRAALAPNAISALAPMFDEEVTMPTPGGHAQGRSAALAAFRDSPSFDDVRLSWRPVRGGISADGTHGFTFGYLTLSGGDLARRERKYLAYWVRRPIGWRVVAYRQLVRPSGTVSDAMLAPSLPAFAASPSADAVRIAAHERSLAAAERAFSDRAQQVGLKAAFREYGRPDAMNMHEGAEFRVGLEAITAGFPDEAASPVSWSSERTLVASSGDLGVSIGFIRPSRPVPEGQPASMLFFTIWRRDRPEDPWRYIAE